MIEPWGTPKETGTLPEKNSSTQTRESNQISSLSVTQALHA